jgi:pimeloyl-ACP methyl ester carboxylesterase
MVRSQHALLTGELKLDHVYAVAGLSMGGMQALQWAVTYPDYMTKAISIVGTPKQTSYDLLLWKSELDIIGPTGVRPAFRTDLSSRVPIDLIAKATGVSPGGTVTPNKSVRNAGLTPMTVRGMRA